MSHKVTDERKLQRDYNRARAALSSLRESLKDSGSVGIAAIINDLYTALGCYETGNPDVAFHQLNHATDIARNIVPWPSDDGMVDVPSVEE